MKKITILFFVFVLTGCASRKVNIVKDETKITIDSVAIVKTDSVSTTNNNIKITENFEEVEIKPNIPEVEMIINGVTYKNTVLRYKKANKVYSDNSKKTVSKKVVKKAEVKKQKAIETKRKDVESQKFYWWLLIFPILWLLWKFKFDIAFWLKEKFEL